MNVNYAILIAIIKKYRPLVIWFTVIISVLYILFKAFFNSALNWQYDYMSIFILLLLFFLSLREITRIQYKKIIEILNKYCDPEKYCDILNDMILQLSSMKKPPDMSPHHLNLSSGLLASGKYEEAIKELETCTMKNTYGICLYYYNLLAASLRLGRFSDARGYLDSLIKSRIDVKPKYYKKCDEAIMLAQYSYNIYNGIYDYAEKAFAKAFAESVHNSGRVSAKFYLSKVYIHNGELELAKEALEYVIANGNKLHIVEEAKDLLYHIG